MEWNEVVVDVRTIEDDPRDRFFDVVTMLGVLEHVIAPRTMMENACRLLKRGGLVFVYTPVWGSCEAISVLLARLTGQRFTRPADRRINRAHLQIFPQETLTNLLKELGFEILSCQKACEYHLPIDRYLTSLGITAPVLNHAVGRIVQGLVDRKLFFRNNMRVLARKL